MCALAKWCWPRDRSSGRWCSADNDRPGVIRPTAVLRYLREFAVVAGERVLIATNNDSA